jgi:hypothetical protein
VAVTGLPFTRISPADAGGSPETRDNVMKFPHPVGAPALGIGASALLTRRLHRLTHGLEPRELTELLYEREAVLHGIGEGMLAVDAAGRVSVRNE